MADTHPPLAPSSADDTEILIPLTLATSAELATVTDPLTITDFDIRSCWVSLRFLAKQFGTCSSSPACLLVIHATLQRAPGTRFKSAVIELKFKGLQEEEQTPLVLKCHPKLVCGEPISVERGREFALEVAFPGGPGAPVPNVGFSMTRRYTTQERMVIHGMPRGNRARWTIDERRSTREGILPEGSFAVVVGYEQLSKGFEMETDVKVAVSGGLPGNGGDWVRRLVGRGGSTRKVVMKGEDIVGLPFEDGRMEFDRVEFEKRFATGVKKFGILSKLMK